METIDDMIHNLIQNGMDNTRILDAMRAVPRERFVPENVASFAYHYDMPLMIGHGQTISAPHVVALMTELLEPRADDRVLEIGTGSGYQAAVLANLAKEVYTVERVECLATTAEKRLKELGYNNVYVRHGNGCLGCKEQAPFDKIIITAASKNIPIRLIEQLKVGGLLVMPKGYPYTIQKLVSVSKEERGYKLEEGTPVKFVPLIDGIR